MDRNTTEILIRHLEAYPCLYAWKSSEYKDKSKRTWALKSIYADLRKIDPTLTVERVEIKIRSLRSQYAREIRHQQKHRSKGELNFTPKLWCFKQLSFLKEHTETKKGFSTNQNYTPLDDDYTCYEEPELKFQPRESYVAIDENELCETDLNDSGQNQHHGDGSFVDDIIEEDQNWVQNFPNTNLKVNVDEEEEDEVDESSLHKAQIIFFRNQEQRAKQKHNWEKKQAAEKHDWIMKIYETKHKILQTELAIKMNELNKKINN